MATYQANYKQTDEEILLGLINHDNGTEFTAAMVIFGEAVSAEDDSNELATNLTLTAATGSGYRGSQTFLYNRVPLTALNDLDPGLVLTTDEATVYDLLPFLNEHFGLNMTNKDIVDGPLPEFLPDVETEFQITAKADSKIFHGTVTLTGTSPTIELAIALPVNELDGLYPPEELPVVEGEEDEG